MEDFYRMPREIQLLYIASELEEDKKPVRRDTVNIKR
nr:MAG TPA: hypothetical protein [Caudoviricetes sp.]